MASIAEKKSLVAWKFSNAGATHNKKEQAYSSAESLRRRWSFTNTMQGGKVQGLSVLIQPC